MTEMHSLAMQYQAESSRQSDRVALAVGRLWRRTRGASFDAGWDSIAPLIEQQVVAGQVAAAEAGAAYANKALVLQGASPGPHVAAQAFGGATREGREVVPELYASVTTAKSLVRRGSGVGSAFEAGFGVLSLLAGTIIRDAGVSAVKSASVAGMGPDGKPVRYVKMIRAVQDGACSRCAILAGRGNYKQNFQRHPGCRCTLVPVIDDDWSGFVDTGFYESPQSYFDSLSEAEQDRVFTKAGAWAIRNGADPVSVVNARRGALSTTAAAPNVARLRPVQIGVMADGSPLMVYATREGTSYRSAWAREQRDGVKGDGDRYRRTTTLRLMPEQIMKMSDSPERAVELLKKYGYIL